MECEWDAGVTKILFPVRRPTSDVIPRPTSPVVGRRKTGDGVGRRTSDVGRRTSDVGRRTSDVKSGLAHTRPSGTIPFVPASNFYTVGQVSSIAEIAEADVLGYIKDGS